MLLGCFNNGLSFKKVEDLLVGFFTVLFDCGGSEARVESLEFEKAFDCILSGLTFTSGMALLVHILLDVDGSKTCR
jgi:hypothetical protein